VIASRYQRGARVRGVPFSRQVLSKVASIMFRIMFPIQGVKDYTSGYRAYRYSVLKQAFQTYGDDFINRSGFSCMVDILLKIRKLDVIASEVPMILRYDQKGGKTKMNITKTIKDTLKVAFARVGK
jgi:dolichol-phosphate mannosyltransferase